MNTYQTTAGDMFDLIAYKKLGDCFHVEKLFDANRDKLETFIFSAGEEISLPEIKKQKFSSLPPWLREEGY